MQSGKPKEAASMKNSVNRAATTHTGTDESDASRTVQKDELEALSSIFGNDLQREKPIWGNSSFTIAIRLLGQDSVGTSLAHASLELAFVYTASYPKTPPTIDVRKPKGNQQTTLPDDAMKDLKRILVAEATRLSSTSLGDPYLFELIRTAQDFLIEKVKQARTPNIRKEETPDIHAVSNLPPLEPDALLPVHEHILEEEARAKKREAWLQEQRHDEPVVKQSNVVNNVEKQPSLETEKGNELHQGKKGGRYYTDYEDLGAVGRGGFGHVYKAKNRLDGMIYAVKKIRLENDEIVNRKTRSEATTLAKLVHPNIVRYFAAWMEEDDEEIEDEDSEDEFDEFSASEPSILRPASSFTGFKDHDDDEESGGFDWARSSDSDSKETSLTSSEIKKGKVSGNANVLRPRKQTLYIVMEFVPRTIRALIDNKELIDQDHRCFELVREILDALSCVHELKIIHQDIKPDNLLIDAQGRVKLGDFGLAVQQQDDRDTTEVGTTYYRAPEVGKGVWDEKCDIFSLGVVLVEMFIPPTETNMERHKLLTNLRLEPPILPDKLKNEEAGSIARQMLMKDPKKRPSAAQALKLIPGHVLVEHAVDTVIKTLKPGSNAFNRLLRHLFSQSTPQEVDSTYDYDPSSSEAAVADDDSATKASVGRFLSELSANNALPLPETLVPVSKEIAISLLESAAVGVVERIGAVKFRTPLFIPVRDDVIPGSVRKQVQFLDAMGVCVGLPHSTLTPSLARFVAMNRNVRYLKRYDVGLTFAKAGGGGQPNSQRQLCFDTIAPLKDLDVDGCRATVIEHIETMKEIFSSASKLASATGLTVEIGHARLLDLLFDAARVPMECRPQVQQVIRRVEFFRDWKHASDALSSEAKCPIGAVQALKFCLPIGKCLWISGSNGEILTPLMRSRSQSQREADLLANAGALPSFAAGDVLAAETEEGSGALDEMHKKKEKGKKGTVATGKHTIQANQAGAGNSSLTTGATSTTSASTMMNTAKLHPVEILIEQAIGSKMQVFADLLKELWAVVIQLLASSIRVRLVIWADAPPDVSGLFFKVMMRRRRAVVRGGKALLARQGSIVYEEGHEFVAGDGGRFDELITSYVPSKASSTLIGCTSRIYLDRIAKLRAHFTVENMRKRPLVRVCWPQEKDAARFEAEERSRLAVKLRAELPGIGVEWIHPKDVSADALLALCRETGARIMVSKVASLTSAVISTTTSLVPTTLNETYRVRGWAFPSGLDTTAETALQVGVFVDKRCESWPELVKMVGQTIGLGKSV